MAIYAGVDLGATNIQAIVATADGEVLGRDDRRTPREPNGLAVTDAVLDALRTACEPEGVDPARIEAVGIASIGPFDLAAGTVEGPANLPDCIDRIPLTGPVGQLAETDEVYLHNDTSAGVIGERFHADRNPDDMVYLTVSSGIGAGIAVDGNVLSGWDGNAGEVGHTVVDARGRRTCGCGHDGHWEAYCSGNNIPGYARLLAEEDGGIDAVDTQLALEDDSLSAAEVFALAGEDAFVDRVLQGMSTLNVIGLANVVHSYAPLVVSIGGAVALNNPEEVVEPIRERLDGMLLSNYPEVRLAQLGEDTVLRGALASALTQGTGDERRAP